MGMSTYVYGIAPADEKWRQMKDIYDKCVAAKISVPEEVSKFFNYETPEENGVNIDLRCTQAVKEFKDDSSEGLIVDLDKLPKHVKLLKFCNSW